MKTLTRLVRIAALLLCSSTGFAQSLLIQMQNGGAPIGTFKKYLVLNCGTNTSCSTSGSTVTITASSTASTAFSGITASANANAGAFSASGNSWDFSAALAFKLPVAAAFAPTADGSVGVNSTNHLPVFGSNGATLTYPATFTAAAHNFVTGFTNTTGVFSAAQPACADLSNAAASCATDATNATNIASGTLNAARLPNPSAISLGGIQSFAAVSNQWINAISTSGVPSSTQPACGNLSNAGGGCSMSTTAGGDLSGTLPSPTVAAVNGNTIPAGAVADQIPVGTAANTLAWKSLSNCTGGASALSYATAGHAPGCLANILTATLTSTRVPFSNGANSLTDSANLIYAAGSGFTQVQGANATDAHYIKRFTDTTPSGNFLRFQDAAALNDLFKVDVLGNLTATSYSTSNAAGNAGMLSLVQGTAPTAVTNAINFLAPASVTTYTLTFPGTVAAGFWNNSSGGAVSYGTLSGDATSSGFAVTNVKVNGVSYSSSPSVDTVPIVTAANTATYSAINNCGDATHALSYNTTTHAIGCQAITATAAAGGSNTQVQFNNSGSLGGSANLTWVSPVLTIGAAGVTGQLSIAGSTSGNTVLQSTAAASGTLTLPAGTGTVVYTGGANTAAAAMTLDLSAATGATAFKVPVIAGATAGADGVVDYDSTNKNTHIRANAADAIALAIPSAPTTGNIIDASVASSVVLAHDSGIATANVVTAASAASAAKQLCTASGASKTCTYVDFPEHLIIPAANCNNATAGAGWSLPATNSPTVACRAGTNNLGGVLQWANNNTTTNAQFSIQLPNDWDTATQPFINIIYGSGANTSGTVKWTFSTACTKSDGSITDDSAFTAESASTGKTMAVANRMWAESLQFTAVTSGNNCIAGSTMVVKVTSGNGTAASTVNVDKVTVTIPRLITVQAN